jgi:pimeloyl-ACP methyl ester carboxylesterase
MGGAMGRSTVRGRRDGGASAPADAGSRTGRRPIVRVFATNASALRSSSSLGVAGAVLLSVAVAVVACRGGGATSSNSSAESSGVATSSGSTVEARPAAEVASAAVREWYREPTDAETAPSPVDVYVGDENEGGPVVVLLHGFGMSGPGLPLDDLGPLGEEVAALGSTVFYFGWQTGFGYSPDSAADLSCVGPFVAARAADFGADPDKIIVVGHSMGAETGSMLAFSSFGLTPSADCTETGDAPSPAAFVGIGGTYGAVGEPLDDEHTRFRLHTLPSGIYREVAADEEMKPGLTGAQLYQLDGYSALPPSSRWPSCCWSARTTRTRCPTPR